MSDQQKTDPPIVPADILSGQGIRNEPLGCPTGLIDPPDPPPGGPIENPVDTTKVQVAAPGRETRRGRQESGRDAQDEEKNEGA